MAHSLGEKAPSAANRKARRLLQKRGASGAAGLLWSSVMLLGFHLVRRIGIGDAEPGERRALDRLHLLGVRFPRFMVVA